MTNSIEELKLEIESLKERVSKLEGTNKKLEETSKTHKTNLLKTDNYYKEEHESGMMVKSLKEHRVDRFGRVSGVNTKIKIAYEEDQIDIHEYNVMLRLAVANQDYVSIKYLMDAMRLEFEQMLEMLNKLKEFGYVEIIKNK